jgi:hypothetical protein
MKSLFLLNLAGPCHPDRRASSRLFAHGTRARSSDP